MLCARGVWGAPRRLAPEAGGARAPRPTAAPPLQERIFLTVSNYIFTAIFVGEMTLKVVPAFPETAAPPPSPALGS